MKSDESNIISFSTEQLANELFCLVGEVSMGDYYWKMFGFEGRPKRGKLFKNFVNKYQLAMEDFLLRELQLITLVELSCAAEDTLPEELTVNVIGRVLEILIDGLDLTVPFWDVFGFPSKDAAVSFYDNGLRQYRTAEDIKERGRVFIERMMQVVTKEKKGVWVFGVAQLTNSPLAILRGRTAEIISNAEISSQANSHESLYGNLVKSVMYPDE